MCTLKSWARQRYSVLTEYFMCFPTFPASLAVRLGQQPVHRGNMYFQLLSEPVCHLLPSLSLHSTFGDLMFQVIMMEDAGKLPDPF